jgi:glycosyltransferase involved in cell wall biosynthesis
MTDAREPLVSVVVAAYRHEAFIERCLQSIVAQTYLNLEIIVVDDASPDGTPGVSERFLAQHASRFARVVTKRNTVNRGAHATLNRGMALARGSTISLMNSDDAYAAPRIEVMLDAMRAAGAPWSFSSVLTIDENDRAYFGDPLCHSIHWAPRIYGAMYPTLSWAFLKCQLTASSGNLLLSRDLVRRVGGFTDLKYCHDWDYVLRATLLAEPVWVPEDLYFYRMHGTNTFKGLGDVAETETRYCLRGHFTRVMSRRPLNDRAAAPQNWPGTFQALVEACGAASHLKAVYDPYERYHRTVDWA